MQPAEPADGTRRRSGIDRRKLLLLGPAALLAAGCASTSTTPAGPSNSATPTGKAPAAGQAKRIEQTMADGTKITASNGLINWTDVTITPPAGTRIQPDSFLGSINPKPENAKLVSKGISSNATGIATSFAVADNFNNTIDSYGYTGTIDIRFKKRDSDLHSGISLTFVNGYVGSVGLLPDVPESRLGIEEFSKVNVNTPAAPLTRER